MVGLNSPQWVETDLARSSQQLREFVAEIRADISRTEYADRIWLGSTYRPNDPYPDHRSGMAADWIVGLPQNKVGQGLAGDKEAGDWLASGLVSAHAAGAVSIRSIIWWGRRWTRSTGWRPYRGYNHKDHVHVWIDRYRKEEEVLTQQDIAQAVWGSEWQGESGRETAAERLTSGRYADQMLRPIIRAGRPREVRQEIADCLTYILALREDIAALRKEVERQKGSA